MKTLIPYSTSVAGMNQKLKKGDKVLTASGDTQTVIRVNSNDNVETEESQYVWAKYNLKLITTKTEKVKAKKPEKSRTEKLKDALKDLCKEYSTDEMFTVLTSLDNGYLEDEVIMWLTIERGMTLVKTTSLTQKMAFEEAMQKIIPFHNDQQIQIFA